MFEQGDYVSILRSRLEDRCRANPRYSLRAFARDLGLAPSRVSEILNRKQGLSEPSARIISQKLGFSIREADYFASLVLASDARSRKHRQRAMEELRNFTNAQPVHTLDMEAFQVISDWYHFAILELVQMPKCRHEAVWIARKLGISRFEAESAIQRLLKLELLRVENGQFIPTHNEVTTSNGVPSEAIRRFSRQILSKASESIDLQTVDERDLSTLTVGIDPALMPKFKEMIRKFRREFNALAVESAAKQKTRPSEVYSLAVQFFRLSSKEVI
jgi:uncharacterized protein (TIGR02147 family)